MLKTKAQKKALRIASSFSSSFDAQGSYTGVDKYDKYSKPVQDADDL